MPSQPEKLIRASDGVRIPLAGHLTESAHYLRQATITLRRRSSWLNQMWCKNRQPVTNATTWKH